MEDDVSQIEEHIKRLKKKKERLQTQKALFLFKEAQAILGDKFSYELAISVIANSWKSSSDKQKEEWIKSANTFRRIKRQPNKTEKSQREHSRSETSRHEDSQTATENP